LCLKNQKLRTHTALDLGGSLIKEITFIAVIIFSISTVSAKLPLLGSGTIRLNKYEKAKSYLIEFYYDEDMKRTYKSYESNSHIITVFDPPKKVLYLRYALKAGEVKSEFSDLVSVYITAPLPVGPQRNGSLVVLSSSAYIFNNPNLTNKKAKVEKGYHIAKAKLLSPNPKSVAVIVNDKVMYMDTTDFDVQKRPKKKKRKKIAKKVQKHSLAKKAPTKSKNMTLGLSSGRVGVSSKTNASSELSLIFAKVTGRYKIDLSSGYSFQTGASLVRFFGLNYKSSKGSSTTSVESLYYEGELQFSKKLTNFSLSLSYENLNYFIIQKGRYLQPKRIDRLGLGGSVPISSSLFAFSKIGLVTPLLHEFKGLDFAIGGGYFIPSADLNYILSVFYYTGSIKSASISDSSIALGGALSLNF
jgi:hypothetical protein